ncbi:Transcriptional regulatory protein, C terminal [Fontibacillus panacisegetis]|uniref:Transcriptional regulatory protein, C terminal n=1 Tax=Fontibacillus panacisegetis TaxID=670482 RepID=A0A1G7EX12_9BACL|nr:winged helix-turn-helix domain-containing protein [Fontibacillus panacisegetis]SDE68199.1 Transcriptional regulatory protein, C terminal [Fontibacillus panacisegetis]
MQLEFIEIEYKVTAEGITVELLPKEFALLQFLYQHRGRIFSREQLLEHVWPLEYPVDRTVDDHIYRLRKKLAPYAGLEIKTIRGLGYSLALQNPRSVEETTPTMQDPELHETMRNVFMKFHRYGQGRSMLTLARQKDVLGFKIDPYYSVYVHFVEGDIDWLLHTNEVSIEERLYWLILYYINLVKPEHSLILCEQLLEKKLMSAEQNREMELLNIIDLYAQAGETDKALDRLKKSYEVIKQQGYDYFIPQMAITEMFVHLVAGTEEHELEQMAEAIEADILSSSPYLRETGSYKIVKGLWMLNCQLWNEGEKLLDEGVQVLDNSGFIPLKLLALCRISFYFDCGKFPVKKELQQKYTYIYDEELERIGLKKKLKMLEDTIYNILNRV